jgi:D-sedoheptulose 7-phosphate isomerase
MKTDHIRQPNDGRRPDESFVTRIIRSSIEVKNAFIASGTTEFIDALANITRQMQDGHKMLIFGNGGSAADAQHIAAELVNRLSMQRAALPAIALTTDTSILTSIANDYDFKTIFTRQVEAFGDKGDIALAISTSGNSPNVIDAVELARHRGMITVGFLGGTGGKLKNLVDHPVIVPSVSAQRIQETHITLGHIMCEWVEHALFAK